MTVKLLTEHCKEFLSFKGGYTGSSESTLVKLPQCWKSHVAGHIMYGGVTSTLFLRSHLRTMKCQISTKIGFLHVLFLLNNDSGQSL